MNYTMITNHAHAHITPPSPLGELKSKKIGYIAPTFVSSEISKTLNMSSKHGTTNVTTRSR